MTAVAVSGVIGSPLSGWIMQKVAGACGWAGWQWLFLLEGLPVLLGLCVLPIMSDHIGPDFADAIYEFASRLPQTIRSDILIFVVVFQCDMIW